jgi:hypothetical protein
LRRYQHFLEEKILPETTAPFDPDRFSVKIAVLSTGVDLELSYFRKHKDRIKDVRSFLDHDGGDEDGQGSSTTELLLRAAPTALIYVAKVLEARTVDARTAILAARVLQKISPLENKLLKSYNRQLTSQQMSGRLTLFAYSSASGNQNPTFWRP